LHIACKALAIEYLTAKVICLAFITVHPYVGMFAKVGKLLQQSSTQVRGMATASSSKLSNRPKGRSQPVTAEPDGCWSQGQQGMEHDDLRSRLQFVHAMHGLTFNSNQFGISNERAKEEGPSNANLRYQVGLAPAKKFGNQHQSLWNAAKG
jgi:hypothetical protein